MVAGDHGPNLRKDSVSDEVSVGVVDLLEMIDVEDGAGQGVPIASGARELLIESGVEHAAIHELGQWVDGRQRLELSIRVLELVGEPSNAKHRRDAHLQFQHVDGLR